MHEIAPIRGSNDCEGRVGNGIELLSTRADFRLHRDLSNNRESTSTFSTQDVPWAKHYCFNATLDNTRRQFRTCPRMMDVSLYTHTPCMNIVRVVNYF